MPEYYFVIKTGDDYVDYVSIRPSFLGDDYPISVPSLGAVRDNAIRMWNKVDALELRRFLNYNTPKCPTFRVVKVWKKR